ncbi:carbohydrate ABC transporter permease [Phytoactinopolyspora limicola]|uniref:carbohydrate ABC transporter permease n=1 Tax=Phytoactinopolyspora limicola TaxID=2715536 RepID=UPI00140E4499|nr:carbohydrate ABC transporter permease [Phytoactinopolyspora limicola]
MTKTLTRTSATATALTPVPAGVHRLARLCRAAGLFLLIVALVLIAIFPIYWMLVTSVQPSTSLFSWPPRLVPSDGVSLGAYTEMLTSSGLLGWVGTSIRVSLATASISVVAASLAAYALSRFSFRGSKATEIGMLATQMFPGILLALPMYLVFLRLGLVDDVNGLTLAYLAFIVPVSATLLKGFFDSIPKDLEEASLIDGTSRMGAFFRVTLPLSAPGLAATFLFAFIVSWNEYLFARILVRSAENWTISLGIASYIGEYVTPWDQIMAGAVLVTLPVAAMFLFLQRYLLQGLTAGAVKG